MNGKCFLVCVVVVGCDGFYKQDQPKAGEPKGGAPKGGVIGNTTTDIKKFDPNAKNQKVSDGTFKVTDPYTAPLVAYGPALERSFIPLINHDIASFHALEGRYPKDYNEFMEKIIKANERRLPVLPGGKRWVYDEKAHELKVVQDLEPPKEENKK
jgi:hypothetical protein